MDQLFLSEGHEKAYLGLIPSPDDVLLQLAEGLAYIHSKGLVHGTIKPENALIWVGHDEEGNKLVQMKWADFGLRIDNLEGSGTWPRDERKFDSNCWLSPELLAGIRGGEQLDHSQLQASDVYSQGLVFGYFLSNGQHLFDDDDTITIPQKIIGGTIDAEYMKSKFHFIIYIFFMTFSLLSMKPHASIKQ